MIPFITAILAITLVGIIAIPLIPLAFFLALTIGMGSFNQLVLRLLRGKYPGRESNLTIIIVTGVLFFMALWALVALLLGSSHRVLQGFGYATLVISILLTVWPFMTGVGAVVRIPVLFVVKDEIYIKTLLGARVAIWRKRNFIK